MTTTDGDDLYENELYQRFPEGREEDHGTGEGFNTYFRLNAADHFRSELLDEDSDEFNPVLAEFVKSGDEISISFAQFKSSTRESEWALHKPHLTMAVDQSKREGQLPADLDIKGQVDRYPGPEHAHIATFIINHEMTMARWKQSVILIEDGKQAGQMVYKHPEKDRSAK
jgi:hypothetical protein